MKIQSIALITISTVSFLNTAHASPIEYSLSGEANVCGIYSSPCGLTGSVFIEENPVQFQKYAAGVVDPFDHWIVSYDFSFTITVENYGDITGNGNLFKHIENGNPYVDIITINGIPSELGETWAFYAADGTHYSNDQSNADSWATLAPTITWMTPSLPGLALNNDVRRAYAELRRVDPVPAPSVLVLLLSGIVGFRWIGMKSRKTPTRYSSLNKN